MKKLAILMSLAMVAGVTSADLLWDDDTGGLNSGQNLTGGTLTAADGVGGRDGVALLDLGSATGQWLNLNSGNIPLTSYAGQEYTFTYDLYVPAATTGLAGQSVYNTVEGGGNGWVVPATYTPTDTWFTKTRTGTIVGAADGSVLVNINRGEAAPAAGTFVYLDNIKFEAIPEPATLGMVAVFGSGLLFIRRRFMI